MRVLVVFASPPLEDGGAPGKYGIGLIRGLRAHGVDVHAVAAAQYFTGTPPDDLGVDVVPLGELAARVDDAARDVDVVHLEQVDAAGLVSAPADRSLVHVHHRVRLDRPLGPPWRNEFRWSLARRRLERRVIGGHRFLLATAADVEATLRGDAPSAEIVRAPFALDGDLYPAVAQSEPPAAGIVGTADWRPTREAMERLIERVWPEVRQRVPGARLRIAGRGTASLPATDGVEILGEVPSAAAFLQTLRVFVSPQPRGSGAKVKTLEALASGLPVVTTRAGAEGAEGGDGLVVSDADSELADATARLLLDPDEAGRLGAASRAAFARTHAPRPATEPVVAFYEQIARRQA